MNEIKERVYTILKRRLEFDLKNAEEKVKEEEKLKYPLSFDEEGEEIENRIFSARSTVIKAFYSTLTELQSLISKEYSHELKYSKENIFPRQWMLKDEQIRKSLEKYTHAFPILNELFNRTRFPKKFNFEEMQELIIEVTGRDRDSYPKYQEKSIFEYSAFLTNEELYKSLSKQLECKIITIKKYTAFKRSGIIIELGHYHRSRLYSDGFYVQYSPGVIRKLPYLINSKEFVKALRHFEVK